VFGDISLWWIVPSIGAIGYAVFSVLNQMTSGGMCRIWFGRED